VISITCSSIGFNLRDMIFSASRLKCQVAMKRAHGRHYLVERIPGRESKQVG